jgi:RNA polymerase sigma-70 factor (ECF subfamily)
MRGPGADRSFERLYRKHVADVYRYASAVLSNPADAEDVTQTVFLNAYRALRTGERPDQPLNWLITIAHNVCRQRFRDGARRPQEVELDDGLAASPFDEQDDGYRREDIVRAFSHLNLNQREALALRELEGRSYGEIAGILGITKSAVETLIFRARRVFREQLEGSLTCSEAERAISLQLDRMLERGQRGSLRAHLRSCPECASLARRFRAQRSALRRIGLVQVPPALASSFGGGGGGAAVGTALGLKAAAFGTAALVATGVGTTELVRHSLSKPAPTTPARHQATPKADAELASAQATSVPDSAGVGHPPLTAPASTNRRHAALHTQASGIASPSVTTLGGSTATAGTSAEAKTEEASVDAAAREQTRSSTAKHALSSEQSGPPDDPSSAGTGNAYGHLEPKHESKPDRPSGPPSSLPPGQAKKQTAQSDVTASSTSGSPSPAQGLPADAGPPADPGPPDEKDDAVPPGQAKEPPGQAKDHASPGKKS